MPHPSRLQLIPRRALCVLAAAATLTAAACSSAPSQASPPHSAANVPSTPVSAPSTRTTLPSASPAASATPAPSALWGTWQPIGSPDGSTRIVLSATGYAFYLKPGPPNTGTLRALGPDKIDIGPGELGCDYHGTYTWRITSDQLHFAGGQDDPCYRATVLVQYPWQRISNSTATPNS